MQDQQTKIQVVTVTTSCAGCGEAFILPLPVAEDVYCEQCAKLMALDEWDKEWHEAYESIRADLHP